MMFASTARSRQPSFSSRRQRAEKQSRFASFLSGLIVIGIATWVGVFLAQYISDHSTLDNSIARFVNGTIHDISQINPVWAAILGGLCGMAVLVFFIRDHN